jgi:hypothetical protein
MKQKILGLLIGGLTLAAAASPAMAAKVTVEIEGQTVVLAPTAVDTPASVTNGGQTCATGASVLGALDVVTKGDWAGQQYGIDAPDTILGENHPFAPNAPSWSFLLNGKTSNNTACATALNDGDEVLWYWSNGFDVYKAPTGYDDPVLLDAPAAVQPGVAFIVNVQETLTTYDENFAGQTAITPSSGATVTAGSVTATTGADGTASLTLPAGPYTIVAAKGNRAPARIAGCATNGHDGFCGTTAKTDDPGATPPVNAPGPPAECFPKGTQPDGLCGRPDKLAAYGFITSIKEGQRFGKGKGARELVGRVDDEPAGIADVQVRLTRSDRGRCARYDGAKERFVKTKRCGAARGTWFSVGSSAQWRYLLPAKLGRGRYVLDVRVKDKLGNEDAQLARGRNRVVFTVA